MKNNFKFLSLKTLLAAIIAAIVFCSFLGNQFEEKIRTILYKAKGDSVPNFAVEKTDNYGVPFVVYATENNITPGKQYNATIIANYAIEYHKKFASTASTTDLEKFKHCVAWLQKNVTVKNNAALYYFNWQQAWYPQVKGTFTSGIASGRAIEALLLAFTQLQDSSYLHLANQLLRGYYLPIENGGFTIKENNGWWYEEIADTSLQTPKILDGHIFAIVGAQKLNEVTKADSAKTIVNKGIEALKNKLSFYDAVNEIIYYDVYKKQADKKYQQILVNQMQQLYTITGDVFFKNYYNKWNKPLQKNYVLKIVQEKNISGLLLLVLSILVFYGALFMITKLFTK